MTVTMLWQWQCYDSDMTVSWQQCHDTGLSTNYTVAQHRLITTLAGEMIALHCAPLKLRQQRALVVACKQHISSSRPLLWELCVVSR